METLSIAQVGLGPLGRMVVRSLTQRKTLRLVAAVDRDPALQGRDAGELSGVAPLGVPVVADLDAALSSAKPHAAVVTTTSSMASITPLLERILTHRVPIVSTCEELSYPWMTTPELSQRVDKAAITAGVAVLGTGVNPGFLMDCLPLVLTAVCQNVRTVRVSRVQDAATRRLPFQQKIGAGLSPADFEKKRQTGTLRHVGLTESMHMIASRLGWTLTRTVDELSPIIAPRKLATPAMTIEAGFAAGVQQIGRGYVGGQQRITLTFIAAVGQPDPADTVEIVGEPSFRSVIPGGINGDIATAAMVLNAVPVVLRANPGLRTMADLPLVSCA